jgi:hypothetical protein
MKRFAMFGVVTLVAVAWLSVAAPRAASANNPACPDGSRSQAASLASQNLFSGPVDAVYSNGVKVELRHSATYGCGWALISSPTRNGDVWIDRSTDGGASWAQGSKLGERSYGSQWSTPGGSTYTGTYDDRFGYVIRACGYEWHYGGYQGQMYYQGPTVCTAWFGGYANQLNPDVSRYAGSSLSSPNTRYRLTMQGDGNLVAYAPEGRPIWASGTNGRGGVRVVMQYDGNLVIVAGNGTAVWATGTNGHPGSVLQVQDDGNVVIYAPGHVAVWATNTAGR